MSELSDWVGSKDEVVAVKTGVVGFTLVGRVGVWEEVVGFTFAVVAGVKVGVEISTSAGAHADKHSISVTANGKVKVFKPGRQPR